MQRYPEKIIFILTILFTTCFFPQYNLDYYIQIAKQNNPFIIDNKNQSKANLLETERLKAFYTKAQLNFTANFLFAPLVGKVGNSYQFDPNSSGNKFETNSAGVSQYYGYDMAATNGGQYQALLNYIQPLFNQARANTFSEQYQILSMINDNTVKLTEHDVEKIVTDQYILCLQDLQQIHYTQSMLHIIEEQKNILQKLADNGIYKKSDVTLINIEYNNFLSQLITFKANYRRDLMDLNILCGITDTNVVQIENIQLSIRPVTQNSNYLTKYTLDSLNLITQQKIFELKYKPQFNAFANTGLNAVYAPTIPNRLGISAGFNLTINILDGNQKNITRNKTKILTQSISSYKNMFIKQNNLRIQKIMSEINSYTQKINIAQQQLKDYESLLNNYKKEILSGQLSIINYLNVLKNMATLQRDYTLLLTQQQLLINLYNYWNW